MKENLDLNKKEIIRKILFSSLIGSKVKVLKSSNKNDLNISGEIIFESANLIDIINSKKEIKKIIKKNCVFEILIDNEKYEIDGKILKNTLTNRIKKMKMNLC